MKQEEQYEQDVQTAMQWLKRYTRPRKNGNKRIGSASIMAYHAGIVAGTWVTLYAMIDAAKRLGLKVQDDGLRKYLNISAGPDFPGYYDSLSDVQYRR